MSAGMLYATRIPSAPRFATGITLRARSPHSISPSSRSEGPGDELVARVGNEDSVRDTPVATQMPSQLLSPEASLETTSAIGGSVALRAKSPPAVETLDSRAAVAYPAAFRF